MGRVFKYSQIVQNRVPSKEDFSAGKTDIINTIQHAADIKGAIICGSLLHGTFNSRSDIDVVLYHLDTTQSRAVIRGLRNRCADLNLDVNIVAIDPVIAKTRYHTISWGFLQHLKKSVEQGGLINEDFLSLLNQDFLDPLGDAAEYISFKLRYLCKSIDELEELDPSSEKHIELLQKGLELPVHVARKYLGIRGIDAGDESKREVIATYCSNAPEHLANKLVRLVELDAAYNAILSEQVVKPNKREYRASLEMIADRLPEVVVFVRENALLLDRQVGQEAFIESDELALKPSL